MRKRFKIVPACYLYLIQDNKILLLQRSNTGFKDGNYSMVAGHLDGAETFRHAMVREAKEEAGIKIDLDKIEVVHVLHRTCEDFNNERIDIFMTVDEWEGEVKNMEPDKCSDLGWFPLDNIPENTIDYIRHVIERVEEGKVYSEFGF